MPMTARYTTLNGRVISQNRKRGGYAQLMRDPLGNVIATADSAGTKKGDTTYWPYGEVRTGGVSADTPFGFCGTWGYYTDSSGRQYVRARYYRQTLGRWQTVDPLWPKESAYGYVKGQPGTTVDPFGMISFIDCDSSFQDKVLSLCARLRELTPKQVDQIASCVLRTSTASRQICQRFLPSTLSCFRSFCDSGTVQCLSMDDYGQCPHFRRAQRSSSFSVKIAFPYGSYTFPHENHVPWSGRLTFLHEVAHACGIAHGKYGSPSKCQCNDIHACCLFEVLQGRDGTSCVDAMKKFIANGGSCRG